MKWRDLNTPSISALTSALHTRSSQGAQLMRLIWPNVPLRTPALLPYLRANQFTGRTMMTKPQTTDAAKGKQAQQPRKKKSPAPTHFLCLPLVNSTSLPQLEASLAAFKAAHPPSLAPDAQSASSWRGEKEPPPSNVPDGSVRPLGTLHLTLGVMNLNSPERLNEALTFFESIDLAELMRDAERVASQSRPKRSLARSSESESGDSDAPDAAADTPPRPITVSLESLHALPRSKVATVLHAAPVDPTSRLYPFCIMLRDKFIEAGFLLGEGEDKLQSRGEYASLKDQQTESKTGQSSAQEPMATARKDAELLPRKETIADDEALLEALSTGLPEDAAAEQPPQPSPAETPAQTQESVPEKTSPPRKLGPYAAALARYPRPRPLLLHATIVNTIYVKGGRRRLLVSDEGKPKRQWPKRVMIDARDLVARYQNYYIDEERTIPRPEPGTGTTTDRPSDERDTTTENNDANDSIASSSSDSRSLYTERQETQEQRGQEQEQSRETNEDNTATKRRKKTSSSSSSPKFPFVWARDIPLDLVCICEMGAKDLVGRKDGRNHGMRARLGQKYTVVAKRSLDFTRPSPRAESPALSSTSEMESEGSVDGGVRLG